MATTEAVSADLTLYSYYRSSCSARLRIALDLKTIPYRPAFINIKDGHHLSDDYASINPSLTVPTLVIGLSDGWSITQSIAALEYLEEAYPNAPSLLPPLSDLVGRAQVRVMVNIIACDIQPVTNMKVLKRTTALNHDAAQWARDFMGPGFAAYEVIARQTAGRFSYKDQITMADICLAPAVWNAERYKLDIKSYPTVHRVYQEISLQPSFRRAHWQNQPDCPEDLRPPFGGTI